jgi:IS5 family transposase
MRRTVQEQQKLVPIPVEHPHAAELAEISAILDEHTEIYGMVHADLIAGHIDPGRGREGMSAEQVIRAVIIKQMNGFSYAQLSFHIVDSDCYRCFCRIGYDQRLDRNTLQRNIKKVRPETLEAINVLVLTEAQLRGVERGRTVRTDCTVEETNIHEPSDSTLLFDVVRVLARLMRKGKEVGYDIDTVDHTRRAKRRMLAIQHAKRNDKRVKPYRELVKLTEKTINAALRAIPCFDDPPATLDLDAVLIGLGLVTDLERFIPLGRQVVLQTKRRVFWNEKVEANEKIVSIFEPHTDIIKKDRRETLFGHKLCLTTGKSGMILDCIILDGNPADSTLVDEAIERQKSIFGRVPRQASFDGGFASEANRAAAKTAGVKDIMFHKKRGMKVSEMVKSSWVYKRLKRFRAGIEGNISFLKRCFGLDRCTWRSLESFKAYTWASVLSANLLILARHTLAT